MEICEVMNAEIVDMSLHFMMIQICASPEKIRLLIDMFKSVSVVEIARTGTLALSKCSENEQN
jgi:acetolactate synthase-1/3 small subunit